MDLTSSIAFRAHSADVVRMNLEDVVPVEKVATDSLWHGVSAYVGITLRCRKCGTDFPFSASEQKAWREDYGFSIHSHPVHCRECRAREREIGGLRKRLAAVLAKTAFSQEDIDELIEVVAALVQQGRADLIECRLKQKVFWAAKRSRHPLVAEVIQALK
jgi:hypothetical protein